MDYGIYIAKIEDSITLTNTRLRVRVLPHMENIDTDMLPQWPSFFRGQIITGTKYSESQTDYVWVLCNNDFTIGYVLGLANVFSFGDYDVSSIDPSLLSSIDASHLSLDGKTLSYDDLIITHWDGNALHFISRDRGAHYIAFRNGTLHVVREDEIASKIGDTVVKINKDEIQLRAKKIRLDGEVRLGTDPKGKVLVTTGEMGNNSIASKEVWG